MYQKAKIEVATVDLLYHYFKRGFLRELIWNLPNNKSQDKGHYLSVFELQNFMPM